MHQVRLVTKQYTERKVMSFKKPKAYILHDSIVFSGDGFRCLAERFFFLSYDMYRQSVKLVAGQRLVGTTIPWRRSNSMPRRCHGFCFKIQRKKKKKGLLRDSLLAFLNSVHNVDKLSTYWEEHRWIGIFHNRVCYEFLLLISLVLFIYFPLVSVNYHAHWNYPGELWD